MTVQSKAIGFARRLDSIEEKARDAIAEINRRIAQREQQSKRNLDDISRLCNETCQTAEETCDRVINECDMHLKRLGMLLQRGDYMLAPTEFPAKRPNYEEIKSLKEKIDDPTFSASLKRMAKVDGYYRKSNMVADMQGKIKSGEDYMHAKKNAAIADRDAKIKKAKKDKQSQDSAEKSALESDILQFKQELQNVERKYIEALDGLDMGTSYIATEQAIGSVLEWKCGDWEKPFSFRDKPAQYFPVGKMRVGLKATDGHLAQVRNRLGQCYSEGSCVGYVWENFEDKPVWIIRNESSDAAASYARFLIASKMRMLPFGRLRVVICDPRGRGTNVGRLNKLLDEDSNPIVIETVETTSEGIAACLSRENHKLGEIGTKLPPYNNVSEYNVAKPNNKKIPYTLLVVNDVDDESFPHSALESLKSIYGSAQSFGYGIVVVDGGHSDVNDRKYPLVERLRSQSTLLKEVPNGLFATSFGTQIELFGDSDVSDEFLKSFVEAYNKEKVRRSTIEITVDESRFVSRDGISVYGRKHIGSAIDGDIHVPFAVGPDDEIVSFGIGGFPNINSLITGSIRSGKSVCLHSLINGIAAGFYPNEIELWLVDFKGTEFGSYKNLPHVKIIGLTTDEDFSSNLLDKIEQEFEDNRKRILNAAGVKKVDDYNALPAKPDGCPDYLSHVVLVIDEFSIMCNYLRNNRRDVSRFAQILKIYPSLGLYCIFSNQSIYNEDTMMLNGDVLAQITGRAGFLNGNSREFSALFPGDFANMKLPEPHQINDHRCIYYEGEGRYTYCKPIMYSPEIREAIEKRCDREFEPAHAKVVDERLRVPLDLTGFNSMIARHSERGEIDLLVGTPVSLLSNHLVLDVGKKAKENFLVTGISDDLRFSLSATIALNFSARGHNVFVVSPDESSNQKRFGELSNAEGFELATDAKGFCETVVSVESIMNSQESGLTLLVFDGLDDFLYDAADWIEKREETSKQSAMPPSAHDRAEAQDEDDFEKLLDEVTGIVSGLKDSTNQLTSATANVDDDADNYSKSAIFGKLAKIVSKGPRFGIYVLWSSEKPPRFDERTLFGGDKIEDHLFDLFAYRFLTKSTDRSAARSLNIDPDLVNFEPDQEKTLMVYVDPSDNPCRFMPYELPW